MIDSADLFHLVINPGSIERTGIPELIIILFLKGQPSQIKRMGKMVLGRKK